jgi:hypothetical protein
VGPARTTRLRDAALAAARFGLYVFPCVPRGKVPAAKGWEAEATRDEEQISTWWQDRPYNIGAAVGRSQLVVIDLDHGRGEAAPDEFAGAAGGIDVLETLAERAGQPAPWDTYSVSSPTGGLHLYFRAPAGSTFRNTAGELGWKIDTRAHGGFVIAAGSVRREGRYTVANDRPIAHLPGWLTTALTKPEPPAHDLDRGSRCPQRSAGHASAYLRAIIARETDAVRTAALHGRNHALNRAAFSLGRLVGGGELDEDVAWHALLAAAAAHFGVERFTELEARRTIASGLDAGRRRPRRLSG